MADDQNPLRVDVRSRQHRSQRRRVGGRPPRQRVLLQELPRAVRRRTEPLRRVEGLDPWFLDHKHPGAALSQLIDEALQAAVDIILVPGPNGLATRPRNEKYHRQLLVATPARGPRQVRRDRPPERVLDCELFKRNAHLRRVFWTGRGLPEYQPTASQENH